MNLSEAIDLDAAVRAAAASFQANELAYLGLTSNSETALRDRLAFHLHTHAEIVRLGWYVSREHSRTKERVDLAILDGEREPVGLVELKHRTSFDMILKGKRKELKGTISQDIAKCRANQAKFGRDVEAYCLLSMTHPEAPIPDELDEIVCYANLTRSAYRDRSGSRTSRQILDGARSFVLDAFREHGVRRVEMGDVRGTAFGIGVDFDWFLMRIEPA